MDFGISREETQKGKSANTTSCKDEDESSTGISLTDVKKEHMFDKAVTPSDVGKLNRLVIPKQHAEKHFPLDGAANDKGLLLNFEDRNGMLWRFRYSYWNSSQSYVMTKGWSRFVKDKKLHAGDIVSFHRGLTDAARDRLFIDCRRRADVLPINSNPHQQQHFFPLHRSVPWSPMLMRSPPPPHLISGRNAAYYGFGSVVYLGSAAPPMGIGVLEWQHQQEPAIVFDSIPVVQGKATAKRLRLFGVNMDCPLSEKAEVTAQCSPRQHPNSSSNAGKGKSSMSLDLDI